MEILSEHDLQFLKEVEEFYPELFDVSSDASFICDFDLGSLDDFEDEQYFL